MDLDLLFTAIRPSDWRKISENGKFEPDALESGGDFRAFQGSDAESIINNTFGDEEEVLLIVLDPLKIQIPMKRIKNNGFQFISIQGAISIDAVIDKIKLRKNKNGKFSVQIKHFD